MVYDFKKIARMYQARRDSKNKIQFYKLYINSQYYFTPILSKLLEQPAIVFTVAPYILVLPSLLFIQLNAQLDCSKRMLKFTLKVFLHVSV
jgi:hypothetical protein